MTEVYSRDGQAEYRWNDGQQDRHLSVAWRAGSPPVDLASLGVPAGTAPEAGSDDPTQNLATPPAPPTRQQQLQDQVQARVAARKQAEAERQFMHAYEEWVLGGQQGPAPQLSDFPASSEPPPQI